MRSVRGNRYGVASRGRPDARIGVALALSFAVINACGGRTLELEGGSSGEGAESGVGGLGGSGQPGSGGSKGGAGGTTTGGSAGLGGTGVSTGGGPGPGARGGGTSTGGTAGVAGTTPVTGGTGMVGGRGGGSSVGGSSPGKGGTGGRPGMPPGRGAGGSAGAPGSGGAAGAAGVGGVAGAGGSPSVYAACQEACANIPKACSVGTGTEYCADSCDDLSVSYPGCRLELTDYIDCVAERMRPEAMCAISSTGQCVGEGCTADAVEACSPLLLLVDTCMAGCETGYGVTPEGCQFQRVCATHQLESWCTTDTTGRWLCTCAVDGEVAASVVLYGDASAICASAAGYCDFAR